MRACRTLLLITLAITLVPACARPLQLSAVRFETPIEVAPALQNPVPTPLPPVTVQQPRLWIRRASGDREQVLGAVRQVQGVTWAAPVRVGQTKVAGQKSTVSLR